MTQVECGRAGCGGAASTGFAISVPSKGMAIEEHDPIQIVLSIPLCDKCFEEETQNVEGWLDLRNGVTKATVREIIAGVCITRRLLEPDFARAFMTRPPDGVTSESEGVVAFTLPKGSTNKA